MRTAKEIDESITELVNTGRMRQLLGKGSLDSEIVDEIIYTLSKTHDIW